MVEKRKRPADAEDEKEGTSKIQTAGYLFSTLLILLVISAGDGRRNI